MFASSVKDICVAASLFAFIMRMQAFFGQLRNIHGISMQADRKKTRLPGKIDRFTYLFRAHHGVIFDDRTK